MGYEADFEATKGLWTPWAEVLCYKCHGPNFREGKPIPDYEKCCTEAVMTPPEGSEVTTCMRCGKWIHVAEDVAILNNVRMKLPSWVSPRMEQTGGMMCALGMTFLGYYYMCTPCDDEPQVLWTCHFPNTEDPCLCENVCGQSSPDAILLHIVKHRLGK